MENKRNNSARPSHLVLFRELDDNNTGKLSSVLKVGAAKRARARANCAVLNEKHGVEPKVFERLGVAVAALDSTDVEKLKADDAVEAVVVNKLRSLPPVVIHELTSDAPQCQDIVEPGGRQTALPPSWCLEQVGVTKLTAALGGAGICVAVLDTGIDLQHPDFRERFVNSNNSFSFIAGESVQDGHGHGTHCAGIVAGSRIPSGQWRYGVAPDVRLLAGKVMNNAGQGYDNQIVDGMDWAAEHGATIITMSLGSERAKDQSFSVFYERVASILLQRGILVIATAGNSSKRPAYRRPVLNPAACPSILSIAAVDQNQNIAPFSCAQLDAIGKVNFCAPGVKVYSAWTGGGFRTVSGTSMAAPHVAGIAALWQQSNPSLKGRALWEALARAALPSGDVSDFGKGLVQAPK